MEAGRRPRTSLREGQTILAVQVLDRGSRPACQVHGTVLWERTIPGAHPGGGCHRPGLANQGSRIAQPARGGRRLSSGIGARLAPMADALFRGGPDAAASASGDL